MESKKRLRELLTISSPIIMEQVFITIMGLVNQLMVANAIGEHAVSAVGIIDSVSNIMISVFAALTTGGTIIVAQYIGRKNMEEAKEAGSQALVLAVILSFFVMVFFYVFKVGMMNFLFDGTEKLVYDSGFSYFTIIMFSFPVLAITQTIFGVARGSGNTATPMLITIIMNVFNVILGYLLIFPWKVNIFNWLNIESGGFGIEGAAWALLLARLVGMILSVIHIIFLEKNIRLNKLKYFKINFATQKNVLGIGIPTSVESSLFQVGRLITQLYIVGMGTAAMFANSVSSNIFGFVNVPGNALSTGVMILVGQKIGRGEEEDVEKTTFFAVKAGAIMFLIISIVLFPMTGLIGRAYNASDVSARLINGILKSGFIATPIFWTSSFVTPAALRATGDVKYTMIIAIASMWIVRIVLGYILGVTMGFGVYGVWVAMYSDWVIRGLFFTLRMKKGGWKKRLAVNMAK
ncbi:MATE family efflux transporter [Anaeropeptidivorans aminofermentans]|uniref:MATE family efflux transporter n=1 Tax=Anaeropeptidivorans aminofermentans TaxID=2934315 RepID=UPI002024AAED|nr:MATE family efflux transporter [Anaeropeptidivorans aminofermentans]